MSMTYSQWKEEATLLNSHKRADLIKAIKVLDSWPSFKEHYKWVGYDLVGLALEEAQRELDLIFLNQMCEGNKQSDEQIYDLYCQEKFGKEELPLPFKDWKYLNK